jgi:hypothetical protein
MALSQPRSIFGVHSVTPYNRVTGLPYGTARVVQGSTFALEGDTIELFGGSQRFSWAIEDGDITAELSFSVSEYPNWLFELFGGKAPTQGVAEASGFVSTLTDKSGSSLVDATTGIATVGVIPSTGAANLKFGKYVVKATAAAAIKVYALSNVDFGRGTLGEFTDDTLEIAEFTGITTGQQLDLTAFGLRLTAGSGTIGMTTGHTATFEVRPVNTFNREVKIGGIADVFPEFGALIYAQKSGNGAVFEIDAFRMKAIGITLGAERKAFAQNDYTAKASYDAAKDAVCLIREIEG